MKNAALLVIDVQKGEIAELKNASLLLENINQAIDTARIKGLEIIFSRHINSKYEKKKFPQLRTQKGTVDSELVNELHTHKNDQVFEKEGYSVFSNEKFKAYLQKQNIKKLYLAGLSSHVCVLLTSADAFAKGYEVFVLKEATAANTAEKHEMGLWWMERYTSEVVSVYDNI